uniref:Uncharacterized protein n=1 Tax=Setaria italica TaxID=4555 RepID=K3XNN8_SETIT
MPWCPQIPTKLTKQSDEITPNRRDEVQPSSDLGGRCGNIDRAPTCRMRQQQCVTKTATAFSPYIHGFVNEGKVTTTSPHHRRSTDTTFPKNH